jgi:hypothetical protein
MLTISRRDIQQAYDAARDADRRLAGLRGRGESITGHVVEGVLTVGGATVAGAALGYFGPVYLAGTPLRVDLLAGLAGHALGFFGVAGKYSDHLHSFSNGVLACYGTTWGLGAGKKLADKQGKKPALGHGTTATIAGTLGGTRFGAAPAPLTEAELVNMAQQVR